MDSSVIIPTLLLSSIVYAFLISIYRLYFSPIAHFPGPKLAALSIWYEGYFDVIKDGKYCWKIKEMHEKYGPVVRINPEELHVNDPKYYHIIYAGGNRKTDKWMWSAKMFGTTAAVVGTTDHSLHQKRKHALSSFFSKQSVSRLEPVIQKSVDQLCERLKEFKDSKSPVNMSDAFACFSADVIGSYVFGKSYGFLQSKNFNPEWRKLMTELSRNTHLMKQFGWLYSIFTCIPEWMVGIFHPLSKQLFLLRREIFNSIEAARPPNRNDYLLNSSLTPVFGSLLQAPKPSLPNHELSTARLTDEGLTLLGAGTVTTSQTLSNTLFYTLSNSQILSKLRLELSTAFESSPSPTWTALSQLPYLKAVLTEGLRLSYGVSSRLPRISPSETLHLGPYFIPAGTPVSMTQMFLHDNPDLFHNPADFDPDRWISSPNSTLAPKHYFVPFSKGTRACLGINLAWAELYLCLSNLLKPVERGGIDFDLYSTSNDDVKVKHDYFNPAPSRKSLGIRVLVK